MITAYNDFTNAVAGYNSRCARCQISYPVKISMLHIFLMYLMLVGEWLGSTFWSTCRQVDSIFALSGLMNMV